jgi:hypothetical protein
MSKEIEYIDINKIGDPSVCPYCHSHFAYKGSLVRHIKDKVCLKSPEDRQNIIKYGKMCLAGEVVSKEDLTQALKASQEESERKLRQRDLELEELRKTEMRHRDLELKELREQFAQLTSGKLSAAINNQNLNILCLGSKDNLLDILESSDGLPNALSYLKGCALARLSGDCRILERVYKLDTTQAAIMYANKSKTKFVYYDERQRRTVESNKEVMAKKLADILQRSYLKGMGSFRTDMLENQRDEYEESRDLGNMPELDPYDVQIWNAHIHELADENYQKKVLKSLKIPTEPQRE